MLVCTMYHRIVSMDDDLQMFHDWYSQRHPQFNVDIPREPQIRKTEALLMNYQHPPTPLSPILARTHTAARTRNKLRPKHAVRLGQATPHQIHGLRSPTQLFLSFTGSAICPACPCACAVLKHYGEYLDGRLRGDPSAGCLI